jgi:hypothetical protein
MKCFKELQHARNLTTIGTPAKEGMPVETKTTVYKMQQLQRASPNSRVKRANSMVAGRTSWASTSAGTLATSEIFAAKDHWKQQSRKLHRQSGGLKRCLSLIL